MSKKDTFYFSHDYGARNDPRLIKVLMRLGHAGKGVFWDLIEVMYEQGGYLKLSECDDYAFALRTDITLLKSLINDFELFKISDDRFWSDSVLRRLSIRQDKSEKAKQSAEARWGKNDNYNASKEDANASKEDANASKEDAIKESKVNKKKVYNNLKPDNANAYPVSDVTILNEKSETAKKSTPEVITLNISFNEFWNLYEKKTGLIKKLTKKWGALSNDERKSAIAYIPGYKLSQPNKRYRKNPETFLNNKSWNDELIEPENASSKIKFIDRWDPYYYSNLDYREKEPYIKHIKSLGFIEKYNPGGMSYHLPEKK